MFLIGKIDFKSIKADVYELMEYFNFKVKS